MDWTKVVVKELARGKVERAEIGYGRDVVQGEVRCFKSREADVPTYCVYGSLIILTQDTAPPTRRPKCLNRIKFLPPACLPKQPSIVVPTNQPPAEYVIPQDIMAPAKPDNPSPGADTGDPGPHPSFIQVAKPYVFQQKLQECMTVTGVNEAKEDNVRLQGVTWIDNVRKAMQL